MNKKLNNKGFSLVELIIVIAIMAVLVGVLAPQFIKYVEQSRRSTDISNAEEIRSAILADIADGKITGSGTDLDFVDYKDSVASGEICASTITTAPKVQANLTVEGNGVKGKPYKVTYDATAGTCSVSVGGYVLTTATGTKTAEDYKTATNTTA